jgi:acetyl-CoA acyltransferase
MSHLQPQDVVIAAFGRSAVGRAKKGSLRNTHPVDFGGQVLRQVLDKVPQLDPKDISDIIIGCSKCEEVQGYNIGRLICLRAGVPYDVPAQTVNRFCSSGLQTIYTAINMIRCGDAEVMVAGGVETMSLLPMGTKDEVRCRWIKENEPGAYMPMGIRRERGGGLPHHPGGAGPDGAGEPSEGRCGPGQREVCGADRPCGGTGR